MRLFHNGIVISLDGARPRGEALLVRDGEVVKVGGAELVAEAGDAVELVDLAGAVIVPGFIDAHNHFSISALEPEMVDCSTPPLESLAEVLDAISSHCAAEPDRTWVRGWGFHSSQVSDQRNPTRAELDGAAPRNPFVLLDVSFHACYVNSAALRETGIDRDTPDPPGGTIERDRTGEPTGTLFERACDLPQHRSWLEYVRRDPELALELIERQSRRFLSLGITSVCDALVTPAASALYAQAREAERLPLSVTQLHGGETFFAPPDPGRPEPDLGDESDPMLRGGMVKIFMDPSYPSPAIDRLHPDGCVEHAGATNYTLEEATELAHRAAGRGLGIAIHCGGDRAVEQALEAFAAVRQSRGGEELTLRIEHSFIGRRGQAKRLAELGVHLVSQPGMAREYGHVFAELRGEEQPELVLFPARTMLDSGVVVAASSDYPCGGGLDPLEIMAAAVDRRRADGVPIEPEEAVSREQALRMQTLDAARSCNRGPIEGSIAPGKRANLAVLDRDPIEDDPGGASLLQTWVDGEPLWTRNGLD